MADFNTELSALITKITNIDADLSVADGYMVTYPHLFSSASRDSVTEARRTMQEVIKELKDAKNLVALIGTLKGV